MFYTANDQLPAALRALLPSRAQDTYRGAFNDAYAAFAGDADRERRAHLIAWAAVKRSYIKQGEHWTQRQSPIS